MDLIKKLFFDRFFYPMLQLYWKVFKPKTYGVRVVVWDKETNKILMVRHAYGDKTMWHFPGGGYNPKKVDPATEAARELEEETGIVAPVSHLLFTYTTNAQGNRDTVEVFVVAATPDMRPKVNDPEIVEVAWKDADELLTTEKAYRITRQTIRKLPSGRNKKEPSR